MRKAESRAKCLPGQILVTTSACKRISCSPNYSNEPAPESKLKLEWISHVGIELTVPQETFRPETLRMRVCDRVLRHRPAISPLA